MIQQLIEWDVGIYVFLDKTFTKNYTKSLTLDNAKILHQKR